MAKDYTERGHVPVAMNGMEAQSIPGGMPMQQPTE